VITILIGGDYTIYVANGVGPNAINLSINEGDEGTLFLSELKCTCLFQEDLQNW
jgi:hypothetical protein